MTLKSNEYQMRVFTILLLMIISISLFGQKIKVVEGIATIDKVEMCKFQDDPTVRFSFYVNNLKDSNILFFKWIDWDGEASGYFEVYKANDLENIYYETWSGLGIKKWIVKSFYESGILTSSGFDNQKLEVYAKKMGREYTRRRNEVQIQPR